MNYEICEADGKIEGYHILAQFIKCCWKIREIRWVWSEREAIIRIDDNPALLTVLLRGQIAGVTYTE